MSPPRMHPLVIRVLTRAWQPGCSCRHSGAPWPSSRGDDPAEGGRMGRIEVDGVGIEFEVHGAGRPAVLLHGFPDTGRLWRHQVPALAEAGFRVIVPDLRGFGRSDKPEAVDAYSIPLLAGDVMAVLAELGVGKAHVVGHDWGAA